MNGYIRKYYDQKYPQDIIGLIFNFYRNVSRILNMEQHANVIHLLYNALVKQSRFRQQTIISQMIQLKLLYRASRDGFTAYSFHSKCDNQGANIIIIHTQFGHIFGAYVSKSWCSDRKYCSGNKIQDEYAFLFGIEPELKLIDLKDSEKTGDAAMWSLTFFGPIIGKGHDLCIVSNCDKKQCLCSPLSFEFDAFELAGGHRFKIKDYEVFAVSLTTT